MLPCLKYTHHHTQKGHWQIWKWGHQNLGIILYSWKFIYNVSLLCTCCKSSLLTSVQQTSIQGHWCITELQGSQHCCALCTPITVAYVHPLLFTDHNVMDLDMRPPVLCELQRSFTTLFCLSTPITVYRPSCDRPEYETTSVVGL